MTDGTPSRLPLDWIAAALRRERTRTGLSLSELAKRAGIAKSTLSQLEAAAWQSEHGDAVGAGGGARGAVQRAGGAAGCRRSR